MSSNAIRHGHADETFTLSNGQSGSKASVDSLTQDDRDILISEDYGHVPKPSLSTYEQICAHYAELSRSTPEAVLPAPNSLDILHVCTQLYFEHFHPQFPVLHQPSFQPRSSSWLLYIAVAAVGSQYSQLSGRNKIFSDLVKVIRVSLLRKLASSLSLQNNLELTQATLLFNFALLFGGTRDNLMHLQYQRNLIVTMCRPLLVPGILFAKSGLLSDTNMQIADWSGWINTESWKRLVYFAWSECPSLASLLKMGVIDPENIRSLSDSALWISLCALYFTERHSTPPQLFYSFPGMHSIPSRWDKNSSEAIIAPDQNEDPVDTILATLQQAVAQNRQDSPLYLIIAKFSLIFRLLRFVKYRFLYVSAGWMAQRREADAAAQNIAHVLKEKPRQARHGLFHAAHLFRIIRSQRHSDPYDAFFLLMAALYIWNYDRLMTLDTAVLPPEAASQEILRIDQDGNDHLREQWISGIVQPHMLVHISGLGVLNGRDSVPRILRESVRILSHEKAWSGHAHAIKHSLMQMLSGASPSFPTEVE
ncbi:hypothetical protein N7540_010942 [Penicillium herquei]|nr:hypothetical protein N7540_010942 [Penicillium herquei]